MIKLIHQFWTPPILNLVCRFKNIFFVSVVPQKLSWVCTFDVFEPQNGLIWVNLGLKQLWHDVYICLKSTRYINVCITLLNYKSA